MQISVRRTDKAAILELTGRIDLSSSAEVRKILLLELRESRTPRVILNLEKVKYIDSSGVASLVEGLKASRDIGSRLSLFGLSPIVREVLQLSRLLKIFEIFENEQRAANHAREDVSKITDPKAQALFETTAEVLNGLVKAFNDFERKNEPAWKTAGPG